MENLAIIPARGGSQAIPLKNIQLVNGRSLLEWAILATKNAECVTRVVVSTDHQEIAKEAYRCGAEVVMRPDELSGSLASSESALFHVLETLKSNEAYVPGWVTFVQCTSPMLTSDDIEHAFSQLITGDYDTVFSGYEEHFSGRWVKDEQQNFQPTNYTPGERPMRQEVDKTIVENGALYIVSAQAMLESGLRFGSRRTAYIMPVARSLQVDAPEDLQLAEAVMRELIPAPQVIETELKVLFVDFDGTLTDNRVYVNQAGEETVKCNRSDGWAIHMLRDSDIEVICITSETNPVVQRRCEKMGIPVVSGALDKYQTLTALLAEKGIAKDDAAFLGNDINDLPAFEAVGWKFAVEDAHPSLKKSATHILAKQGGCGALLELAELIVGKAR